MIAAYTMTNVEEATGIVSVARELGVPFALSFTLETDGRLPSHTSLAEAIEQVDEATGGGPTYYMINCAHPTHFAQIFSESGPWGRIRGIRANASRMSHAELDEATELDAGDPADLAAGLVALREALPDLAVIGGCCGTDLRPHRGDQHPTRVGPALTTVRR